MLNKNESDRSRCSRSHYNLIFFKTNMRQTKEITDKLTVTNIIGLVELCSFNESIEEQQLDLCFEKAKLAILDLFNNQIESKFPDPLTEETLIIDSVEINDWNKVEIVWHRKGTTMQIGNHFSIEEYLEITATSDNIEISVILPEEDQDSQTSETLEVLESLKDNFNNYIPLYEVRNRLPHLDRDRQDEELYKLMRLDLIELSKLAEPWHYSDRQGRQAQPGSEALLQAVRQRLAGIEQPCGGAWFFAIAVERRAKRDR